MLLYCAVRWTRADVKRWRMPVEWRNHDIGYYFTSVNTSLENPLCIHRNMRREFLALNSLNAELNSICHLLVLLGNLTSIGPCIVNIFQYISNKMQRYTLYLYLETALHVSGGTSTFHQERIQLYPQHLVFVTPLLLSAAIVEELEPVRVCCGWLTPPTAHSSRYANRNKVLATICRAGD
jgi:hypothetical protein